MTTRAEYLLRATDAYENYMKVQQRISKIEANALVKYDGNSGLVANRLKSSDDYWLYRDLCADRTRYMDIARLNASMAAIA